MDPYHPHGEERAPTSMRATLARVGNRDHLSLLVPMGARPFTGSRAPQVRAASEGASHYVIVTGVRCCPDAGEPHLACERFPPRTSGADDLSVSRSAAQREDRLLRRQVRPALFNVVT